MLEHQMLEQLKSVFSSLESEIELVYHDSTHPKQGELKEMLEQVAGTSEKITAIPSGQLSEMPFFEVKQGGESTGIRFSGIPGGHEFTSLILAILNADRKGKLPDAVIIDRIRRLNGPIHLKTYISQSCENCPEVVQALNIMAVFHPELTHEMVDGALFQDAVSKLGIQGVPSVMDGSVLVSSGKTDLVQLLAKLEAHVGTSAATSSGPVDLGDYDVAVIGGGPAGASASIYTARKGLKTVLVAENIGGQVKETRGIENMISVPYTEGPELAARLLTHIEAYDIKILEHRRLSGVTGDTRKQVTLDSGEVLNAGAVIIATGAKWKALGIPGEKTYIGRGVAFCPHCDGPFYKGKDVAVIGGGNSGIEAAIDLAGLVKSVTVVEIAAELKADDVLVKKLNTRTNVTVITGTRTTEVVGNGEKVTGLIITDQNTGEERCLDVAGIFVQIGLLPNSECIADQVETNAFGEIVVDEKCRTSVNGIYAAGDVTTVPFKQIVISMGEGAKAALTAFEELVLHG
ncbi:MAG: alkyl hydroperoxide reductase subunit F [Deltaproteobacteria bacterium]|nr:MAG: alkyl hydroperoxide reductase subunit F [Deltaproteobacteria bacterium]